eukprot:TRINITY_DN12678_c0_g1_i1.p1 TRINITY_DN12678_c0_g1~~TRINITY_DN12678_c0_g1_i1.p1  ORF type:complete len:82 (-),score=14.27 TRINITY_DN12678_c0_g1_i1:10-255(-)
MHSSVAGSVLIDSDSFIVDAGSNGVVGSDVPGVLTFENHTDTVFETMTCLSNSCEDDFCMGRVILDFDHLGKAVSGVLECT